MFKYIFAFVVVCAASWVGYSQSPQLDVYDPPNLTFKEEMRRLDGVAQVLQQQDKVNVYLFGFNKEGQSKATAINRLKKSKNYLVRKHHIPPSRIGILYVGE